MASTNNKNTNPNGGMPTRDTVYNSYAAYSGTDYKNPTSGSSMYNVFKNADSNNKMSGRSLVNSRLWHGVPQLSDDQIKMFEAAYTGHEFFFVTGLPKFMTTGRFADENNNYHQQALNLKAIIEKCCVSADGFSNITADTTPVVDGNNKINHLTNVSNQYDQISLTLHEFAGLPLKNAIETWLTGAIDPVSKHGNYFGNLGIEGGWCTANHSMSMLVVNVDPSWTEIQDAYFVCNMIPYQVPNDFMQYDKSRSDIVPDATINFPCVQIRSAQVMEAAEKFMNNRILNMVNTSVYDYTKFKPISTNTIDDIKADSSFTNYDGSDDSSYQST